MIPGLSGAAEPAVPLRADLSVVRGAHTRRRKMEDANDYASGNWYVKEGSEDGFLARWREFLEWTSGNAPGFQHAFLLQGSSDARHFVSYSTWDDLESEQKWRTLPDFRKMLGACRDLCDDFQSDAYQRVISVP